MNLSPRHVLVIDDDPWIRELVSGLLEPSGFQVESASLGLAGLERIRAGFEGVVVLDVLLPELDGTEIFKQLKALSPDLPVIFLRLHPLAVRTPDAATDAPAVDRPLSMDPDTFPMLRQLEDTHVKTKDAHTLGVSRVTLYRKLEAIGLSD
jgi:DNA-binding NtrC family response regulator